MKLLDTETIVELLRKREHEFGAVSIITLMEILRGVEAQKITEVKELLEESFIVINLNNKIIKIYCRLYQKLKESGALIPDADLLIAATAIAQDLTLETRNQHFQRLKELGLKTE